MLSVTGASGKWPLGCDFNKSQENTLGFEGLSINIQIPEFEDTKFVLGV